MTDTLKISRELLERVAMQPKSIDDAPTVYGALIELRSILAQPSEQQGGDEVDEDDRSKWTVKDWYSHLGAWENERGQLCFGSTIAFAILLEQFQREAARQHRRLMAEQLVRERGVVDALYKAEDCLKGILTEDSITLELVREALAAWEINHGK